ncbi:hypothetical protein LOAG_12116 [Loa loa]|uniref:Uncharacterized protein n=1 Tax=Loa loa TaxID=7209 RepID=A0A1S0TLU2_LOALO|nr:hypothetical protein LOAG_12116 [Loa loa]EFO16391.1 hypothetical protein LOAG_12116 [Loa loa]
MDYLSPPSLTPRILPSALPPYNLKHPLDYISNVTAHAQVRVTSIEAILLKTLRWGGHVSRMEDHCLPKIL